MDYRKQNFDALVSENSNLYYGSQNWDITELYESGGGAGEPGRASGSGKDSFHVGNGIARTVTVGGKVYFAAEVNYYLYGTIIRAIEQRAGSSEYTDAMSRIELHRTIRYAGSGTNGRKAWFRAGYNNDLTYACEAALPNAIPNTVHYSGSMFAWWGHNYDVQVRPMSEPK